MNQSAKTTMLAMTAALIFAVAFTGCGMNRNYANNQIRLLPHSKVAIEYTVNEPAVMPASAESSGDESNRPAQDSDKTIFSIADDIEVTVNVLPAQGIEKKVLTITYPHPNPKYARRCAEVTLRDAPKGGKGGEDTADKLANQLVTNPFRQQDAAGAADSSNDTKVLRTVVNREELEFLLRDLVADSFFDREERQGGVDLSVSLGSRTTHKPWDHVKSFDELATRVVTDNAKPAKPRRAGAAARAVGATLMAPTLDGNESNDEPISPPEDKGRELSNF